jgi:hypothetical protein
MAHQAYLAGWDHSRFPQVIQSLNSFRRHVVNLLVDGASTLRAKWTSAAGHWGNSPVRVLISTG